MQNSKYYGAFILAQNYGIAFNEFHQLSFNNQAYMANLAKIYKYRKPINANGSTARYFFALLKRRYIDK